MSSLERKNFLLDYTIFPDILIRSKLVTDNSNALDLKNIILKKIEYYYMYPAT